MILEQFCFAERQNYGLCLNPDYYSILYDSIKKSELELALLARYVYTYDEFVIVTEAPQ